MTVKENYPATWFREHQIAALEVLLSGEVLTSDRLHDGKEPPHHAYWGALFKSPEITRVAVSEGWTKSLRTSGVVNSWRLKPGAVETARQTLAALKSVGDGNELGQVA